MHQGKRGGRKPGVGSSLLILVLLVSSASRSRSGVVILTSRLFVQSRALVFTVHQSLETFTCRMVERFGDIAFSLFIGLSGANFLTVHAKTSSSHPIIAVSSQLQLCTAFVIMIQPMPTPLYMHGRFQP